MGENSVFLHICCGPCSLMPVVHLREEGFEVTAFFFNPNIHPEEEYELRRASAQLAAKKLAYPLVLAGEAQAPAKWIKALNGITAEGERCVQCYRQRLLATAQEAKKRGFRFFTTSLLYSRYQRHVAICREAEQVALETGVAFLYRDFRPYWYDGINLSKELGLYRQKWCGCLLSRKEAEIQREQRAEQKRQKALARKLAMAEHMP